MKDGERFPSTYSHSLQVDSLPLHSCGNWNLKAFCWESYETQGWAIFSWGSDSDFFRDLCLVRWSCSVAWVQFVLRVLKTSSHPKWTLRKLVHIISVIGRRGSLCWLLKDPKIQLELQGFDTPSLPCLHSLPFCEVFCEDLLSQKAQQSTQHVHRALRWGHPADLVAYQVDLDCLWEMPIIYGGSWP